MESMARFVYISPGIISDKIAPKKQSNLLRNILMKAIYIKATIILMNERSILANHRGKVLGNH